MEKVTEYDFPIGAGKKTHRKVFFDDGKIISVYDDNEPDNHDARWYQGALSSRPYEALHPQNQIILDFLNGRLGEQ